MKYKCGLCQKQFQSKKDLDRHLRKIHGTSIAEIKPRTKEEKSEFIEQCVKILDKMEKQESDSNSSQC